MKPGFPAAILLNHWGEQLYYVFGAVPYVVGSCAAGKGWRDVDVVVMLDDEQWLHWFGKQGDKAGAPVWEAICLSFSLWGQKVTGLPIDFKVQNINDANAKHGGKTRAALHTAVLKELGAKEVEG